MSDIRVVDHPQQFTAAVRERVPRNDLTSFFSRAFRKTMEALEAQGMHPAGAPFGRYFGPPTDSIDVEAGFPVASPIEPTGDVRPGVLPAARIVEATHVGPFDEIGRTYAEIERYMADANLTPGAVMWESYLSDPDEEPDPARWRTSVCWPIG